MLKLIPAGQGFDRITEAVTAEFGALIDLVRQALRDRVRLMPGLSDYYVELQGVWPDRVVARLGGRLFSYPYTVGADNTVAVGDGAEVVLAYANVREAVAAAAGGWTFRESTDGSNAGAIEVTLIRGGLSKNGNFYPDTVLQADVQLFEGVRVFVKSDAVHTEGGGKDVRNLLGGVYGVRFVPGTTPDTGALVGTFKPIDPSDAVVTKMTEAVKRGLQGLMGLSIDASARTKRETRDGKTVRVAQRFVKVASVDLIVEPGAGGGLDRLAEAAAENPNPTEPNSGESMLKKHMMAALAAMSAVAAAKFNAETATDAEVIAALTEACSAAKVDFAKVMLAVSAGANVDTEVKRLVEAVKSPADDTTRLTEADRPVTRAEMDMWRVRQLAAQRVASSKLPQPAQDRLNAAFGVLERFTEADIDTQIKAERAYLAHFTESGTVRLGDGSHVVVEDRSKAIGDMLDAFFDPEHKDHRRVSSLRECYVEITGDRRVTGRLEDCDRSRLAESLGVVDLREAVSSATFANALGNSITRRMLQVFAAKTDLQQWRKVATWGPVNDFRSQERVVIGGYGNLPTVAESGPYTALSSPGDLKATYAVAKRGGIETLTLEMIKNDDVSAARRIPVEMALAAANTLFEFVMDFYRTNPTIYDTVALYHASHNNLFTAALSATEYSTHRLAMAKQVRLSSNKRRGVTPKTVLVPFDGQELAYNLFVRGQNLDKTFVQNINPDVIPVAYWTDTNDWVTVADPMDLPVLEVGFLDGKEEPEIFVQDMPNVGSLFSNDQITYKIRHIYGAAVLPEGEKGTTKAVVP